MEKSKLLAFESTHDSLKAEDIILSEGIKVNPIPLPKNITARCGLGLKIVESKLEEVLNLLNNSHIDYVIHDIE
ncbi:DUF3343 domain-containing protein [Alkalicella caledoniensis]|uniref:DUF3343 domain-containing protein n=1 Tax=Alkalicella caledoniensis TaxID=2731377 RepID=A0A7G9W8Y9_ALKCA|nr:DUF3343 domain-containing protein [Alkalicella caledoniensis]QNO15151.1 DUF3343 domain-containing protein [Alkalicella caledoniensis]